MFLPYHIYCQYMLTYHILQTEGKDIVISSLHSTAWLHNCKAFSRWLEEATAEEFVSITSRKITSRLEFNPDNIKITKEQ